MSWKQKIALLRLLSSMPGGPAIHRAMQRHVTRSLPRPLPSVVKDLAPLARHARTLHDHFGQRSLEGRTLFEFGAGADLYGNVMLWCLGVDRQITIDIARQAELDLVNHVILAARDLPSLPLPRRPARAAMDLSEDLERLLGISYRAPGDARGTGLPAGSIDMIVTTNTLEHIPEPDLRAILAECHRILTKEGIVAMKIDYSDHCSHADPSITPYNYLSFPSEVWNSRFNPANHYQNRLRHCDYSRLFREAGFSVFVDEADQPDDAQAMLASVQIAAEFARYSREELLPISGYFAMRKSGD
jgi:hypothetical protein